MFTLKSRQDLFKCTLPKEFIPKDIEEKYSEMINKKNSFIHSPIEFLNETIQGIEILGFTQASVLQQQHGTGTLAHVNTIDANKFLHASSDVAYRSEANPLNLIDKTLRITFRHTLGFINYFMLLESFWVMYRRDTTYAEMPQYIEIELFDDIGSTISKIRLYHPIIDGIDMLSLNYTAPIANSQTFNVEIKYSNIEFDLLIKENIHDLETRRKEVITTI